MKKHLFILLFLSIQSNCFACINEYRTLLNGETKLLSGEEYFSRARLHRFYTDSSKLEKQASNLLESYHRSDSIEYLSDYASALIYLGDYAKAKKIYEEIESTHPNLYTTASNLGTIYELIGKPDSALVWIRKSVELNPQSHKGSEWIHIKILEFKISNSEDFSESILDLDFGSQSKPQNSKNYDLDELESHILHQIKERTYFVKPKNEIVGNIYFDLGNVVAQTRDIQSALYCYEMAQEYGFDSELMQSRIGKFKRMGFEATATDFIKGNIELVLIFGMAFIVSVFIFLVYKVSKNRNTKIS